MSIVFLTKLFLINEMQIQKYYSLLFFLLKQKKNNNNFMKEQQFSYIQQMAKENRKTVILGKMKIKKCIQNFLFEVETIRIVCDSFYFWFKSQEFL